MGTATDLPIITPCPFCGHKASLNPFIEDKSGGGNHDRAYVACEDYGGCAVIGPGADSNAEAVTKWNRAAATIAALRTVAEVAEQVLVVHGGLPSDHHPTMFELERLVQPMSDLRAALAKVRGAQ